MSLRAPEPERIICSFRLKKGIDETVGFRDSFFAQESNYGMKKPACGQNEVTPKS